MGHDLGDVSSLGHDRCYYMCTYVHVLTTALMAMGPRTLDSQGLSNAVIQVHVVDDDDSDDDGDGEFSWGVYVRHRAPKARSGVPRGTASATNIIHPAVPPLGDWMVYGGQAPWTIRTDYLK